MRRYCKLGTVGSALSGFLFGFGIGPAAAREFGTFTSRERLYIAIVFGVAGMVSGFLVGLAQFCEPD